MAKTKLRQLAALAAQAELKGLVRDNERTSSGTKSGPSWTIPQADDPNVEIRTQRVIFKIPALPQKPAGGQLPKIAKNGVLGQRRRRKPMMDTKPSSGQVPADEAKISKGIVQSGKWKRHKKIMDLLPTGVNKVPPSAGLSNGGRVLLPLGKSVENEKHQNGELHLSVIGPRRPSKKRVRLMTGSRKRAKLQEVVFGSPTAEKEWKLTNTQGVKLQDMVVRSPPAEKGGKLLRTQGKSEESKDIALAMVGNRDLPSTLAHLQASLKRRRGNIKKVLPQVQVVRPKGAAVSHHRSRSRLAKMSYCEALALEVLQEIRNVKNVSQQMENLGNSVEKDPLLVRSGNGASSYTTREQSQAEPQNSENFTCPLGQEKEQVAHVGHTADSWSHSSYHSCSRGDTRGGLKSQLHISFAPGEYLVGPKQNKGLGESTAKIMKRESQLRIMQKRLEAAGGLGKWLLDKGLGQILPIIEKWNLDNLSLMQLTMERLKSMGLLPVGTRRKLIHAISSLTLPSFIKPALINANGR